MLLSIVVVAKPKLNPRNFKFILLCLPFQAKSLRICIGNDDDDPSPSRSRSRSHRNGAENRLFLPRLRLLRLPLRLRSLRHCGWDIQRRWLSSQTQSGQKSQRSSLFPRHCASWHWRHFAPFTQFHSVSCQWSVVLCARSASAWKRTFLLTLRFGVYLQWVAIDFVPLKKVSVVIWMQIMLP